MGTLGAILTLVVLAAAFLLAPLWAYFLGNFWGWLERKLDI
jgi:hypothetical protein